MDINLMFIKLCLIKIMYEDWYIFSKNRSKSMNNSVSRPFSGKKIRSLSFSNSQTQSISRSRLKNKIFNFY